MKNIYELELHEHTYQENDNFKVTRVPGGWIYRMHGKNYSSVFIPFNNEFQ